MPNILQAKALRLKLNINVIVFKILLLTPSPQGLSPEDPAYANAFTQCTTKHLRRFLSRTSLEMTVLFQYYSYLVLLLDTNYYILTHVTRNTTILHYRLFPGAAVHFMVNLSQINR